MSKDFVFIWWSPFKQKKTKQKEKSSSFLKSSMLIFLGWMWSGSNRGWTTFGDGNISEPRSTILELEMKKRTWNSSRRDSFSVYILYIRNICLCLHGDTEYYLHSSPKKRETRNKSKIFIQQQRESIIIKEWRERQKKKKNAQVRCPPTFVQA